jgi:predicted alpha/beta-hydrolase family hydrolase
MVPWRRCEGDSMLWLCPADATAAIVFAHGAGAGMRHASMEAIATAFAGRGLATLRFDFPFMAAGRKRVDPPAVATAAIGAAFAEARARTSLPIWLGGHSFGGRMATHALLEHGLPAAGLVLCSFPLHPAGKPGVGRASHLQKIVVPMLFLSGTRDALAERSLLEPVVAALPRATLHFLDTADHGYRVQRRSRASEESVFDEMARVTRTFVTAADGAEIASHG